eukprot:TRINITY_DN12610_c0_g1_i1.p1 TRINITY_DN12610_c0_g1~~TRINITY_DN12610_c0_g1_i1.p1  ORF type:complete len:473 (+),score=106.50 TRINITY_DN12610_c0_g1_i1:133-1551(+)
MSGFDPLYVVTFLAGTVVALAVAAGLFYAGVLRRSSDPKRMNQKTAEDAPSVSTAWQDVEKGETNKADADEQSVQQLCEGLKKRLQGNKSNGARVLDLDSQKNLSDLMACLERQLGGAGKLPEASRCTPEHVPPVGLRGAAAAALLDDEAEGQGQLKESFKSSSTDTRTPSSSDRSGSSSERGNEDLPGVVALPPHEAMPRPPSAPPAELDSKEAEAEAPLPPKLDLAPPKVFGPTCRQNDLVDPPEKFPPLWDEEESERHSLGTIHRVLAKRDAQTTELHKQLRQARQQLWEQTAEARQAKAHLNAYLADTSQAPRAQAEAIARLRGEVEELSGRLADCRQQEQYWSSIAKRQRAFFQQSERISQEGLNLLRRHPAGDIFLAPQPVVLEDDEPRDEPMWDVGTSHCNPYAVDSWPFEPNVLAAKASAQPNLHRWEEGTDEECGDDDDEEHLWGQPEDHINDGDESEEPVEQ